MKHNALKTKPHHLIPPKLDGPKRRRLSIFKACWLADEFIELRKLHGLTRQELADAAEVSRATVQQIESKKVGTGIGTATCLATALGYPLGEIIAQIERTMLIRTFDPQFMQDTLPTYSKRQSGKRKRYINPTDSHPCQAQEAMKEIAHELIHKPARPTKLKGPKLKKLSNYQADALAEEFANLRKRQGLTQTQLADDAGVSRSTIQHIENRRMTPSVEVCFSIALALGYPLGHIIRHLEQTLHLRIMNSAIWPDVSAHWEQ